MIQVSTDEFDFTTDEESLSYLRAIVETMMVFFGIPREECIGRINESWSHVNSVEGEFEPIYRESAAYWANHFMYGHDSKWWIDQHKRQNLGLPPLRPLPYPRTGDTSS